MNRLFATLFLTMLVAAAHGGSETTSERIIADAAANHVKEALWLGKPLSWKADTLVVPTAKVAEAIHSAVAGSAYGDEHIQQQKPFRAIRSGEYWIVFGSLPKGWLGGTAVTVIRANNGEILRIIHEQ